MFCLSQMTRRFGSTLCHGHSFETSWAMCRAGSQGECRESETSVMCKDFLRMGYSSFIVDPGVRLAYHPGDAHLLYTSKVGTGGLAVVSFA